MTNAINWTSLQLRLFSRMHRFMLSHQADFTRPGSRAIDLLDWRAIARNSALYAAHNMVEGPSGETKPAELEAP